MLTTKENILFYLIMLEICVSATAVGENDLATWPGIVNRPPLNTTHQTKPLILNLSHIAAGRCCLKPATPVLRFLSSLL